MIPTHPTQVNQPAGRIVEQELSVRGVLAAVWRGRWILLVCLAVSLYLGFREVKQTGELYRAESRLYVQGQAPSMIATDGLSTFGERNLTNTQAALIQSIGLLQEVVARPEVEESPLLRPQLNKVGWLRSQLGVNVGRKDDLITVSLTSENVEEACALVNAVVEGYRRFLGRRGESTVQDMLEVLTERRKSLQSELSARVDARNAFLEENAMLALDPEGTGSYEIQQLNEFRSQLTSAERMELEARGRLAEARLLQSDPELLQAMFTEAPIAVVSTVRPESSIAAVEMDSLRRTLEVLSEELRERAERRVELLDHITEEHPELIRFDERVARVEARRDGVLEQLGRVEEQAVVLESDGAERRAEGIVAFLERRAEAAAAQVAVERKRVDAQHTLAVTAGELHAQYRKLEDQAAETREVIDEIAGSIRELDLAEIGKERISDMSVTVLDPASPDTAVVASSASGILLRYLILGLLSGAALTWLRHAMDQKLRSESDLTQAVPAPLLGVLPKERINYDKADAIDVWDQYPTLGEAARSLRTAIYFSLPAGEGPVLHITSPQKGDGKSTTTAMLGIAMAQAGQSVLILDADLRAPKQSRVFHLPNEFGLSDALAGELNVLDVIQCTRVKGLDVLTSGPRPRNPAEMLTSKQFEQVLERLTGLYDRVLIDSPPVLAVTDARILTTKSSATLLVTRVDGSTRNSASAAYERIITVNGRVLGTVLNAMPTGVGYGYGYGYEYGYGGPFDKAKDEFRADFSAGNKAAASHAEQPVDSKTAEALGGKNRRRRNERDSSKSVAPSGLPEEAASTAANQDEPHQSKRKGRGRNRA